MIVNATMDVGSPTPWRLEVLARHLGSQFPKVPRLHPRVLRCSFATENFVTVLQAGGIRPFPVRAYAPGTQAASVQEDSDDEAPNFKLHKVAGDGSCLFRSLAQGDHYLRTGKFLGNPELQRQAYGLRQKICEALLDRQEEMQPFVTGSFNAYVGNMMLEGTWGGEVELAVAPDCLGRPVLVYGLMHSGWLEKRLQKISEYGVQETKGAAPVCLLFSGNHYDLLIQDG